MLYKYVYSSPCGNLFLYNDGNDLCGLYLEDISHDINISSYDSFSNVCTWLDRYFSGKIPDPREIQLKISGSEFCLKVWQYLLKIPYGRTITYGQIAKDIGSSPRAVGRAVGRNPISIIIPCHRVIGANNNLTGYGGGIENKIKLLKYEGVNTSNLKRP